MTYVPDELMLCILMWLPVKSLLRFRGVSKAWCELIDSDDFVKRHLNNSIHFKNNHNLVLNRESTRSCHFFGLYSLEQSLVEYPIPVRTDNRRIFLIGSSNGLLCLHDCGYPELFDSSFIIWNPFTRRKHVMLDVPESGLSRSIWPKDIAYGFGYDSVSDDYKVVILPLVFILMPEGIYLQSQTYIYSLKSNYWRRIPEFPRVFYKYHIRSTGWIVCGALHWVVIIKKERSESFGVVAFDLVTEEQKMITLPDFNTDHKISVDIVSELDGCLSIMCYHPKVDEFCVWLMKDYGVTESWITLFTISRNIIPSVKRMPMIPLAYSENGDEVLLMLKSVGVFWYNLDSGTVKFVKMLGVPEYSDPIICVESLVSPSVHSENDENKSRKKRDRPKDLKIVT